MDIKKKYNASWALVTGAGTGIGRSLAVKLASQGLNLVLVSLPDEHLAATTKRLQEQFPNQQVRLAVVGQLKPWQWPFVLRTRVCWLLGPPVPRGGSELLCRRQLPPGNHQRHRGH